MKRWIRCSDDYYTALIDDVVNPEVEAFMEVPDDEVDYMLAKSACLGFWNELKILPSVNSMETLDIKYDEDKRRFYKKYRPFADKCRRICKTTSGPSGYGGIKDYAKLKMLDFLRKVDYNFPYGWKSLGV